MSYVKHSIRTVRRPCYVCGRKDLYMAHDTENTVGQSPCDQPQCHGTTGRLVLTEMDGVTRHTHKSPGSHPGDSPVPASPASPVPEIPDSTPSPSPASPVTAPNGTEAVKPSQGRLAVAAALLEALSPKVDAAEVRRLITEQHESFANDLLDMVDGKVAELSAPVTVKVERTTGDTKTITNAHNILPTVLKIVGNARKHVLMVGPAGTGKSRIASQIAEAIGVPFREISLSPAMSPTALLGYMQAEGKYVRSAFREIYEHGGIFHFDEMDNGHPGILTVINAALANGHCEFPDGRIAKHPDAYIVASANTYGRGADRVYVGRQPLDGSTLDRFVVIDVDYDEGMERELCLASGLDATKVGNVLRYVRSLRANAATHKMPVIVSMRGAINLCDLVMAGIPASDAIGYTLRKGLSDADWSKLTSNVTAPEL